MIKKNDKEFNQQNPTNTNIIIDTPFGEVKIDMKMVDDAKNAVFESKRKRCLDFTIR